MPRNLHRTLLTAPLLLAACATGHRVYHVSMAPTDVHGVHYALPRVALSVDLEVTRHREVRGACQDESALRANLGLEPASDPKGRGKRVAKPQAQAQAQAAPQGEPLRAWTSLRAELRHRVEVDPDEVYVVDLRGRSLESLGASMELSESGILSSARVSSEDRALDLSLAAVGGVVDVAGAVLGATFAGDERSTACERYANQILELRTNRSSIYSGEWRGISGGLPQGTLDRILAGLDRQEAALLALFTTTTRSERATVTCAITPSWSDRAHLRTDAQMVYPLVHVDRAAGTVSPADPGVRCVIPEGLQGAAGKGAAGQASQGQAAQNPAVQGAGAGQATAYLTLTIGRDGLADQVDPDAGCKETREGRCAAPQGLYYRIPREARAEIMWTAPELLLVRDLTLPQLGVTVALPANTGRLRAEQAIALYPESGALRTLSAESSAVTPDQIDRAVDDAVRLIDAGARAQGRDRELLRLERERAVLEESVRIKEAREKLGEDEGGGEGGSSGPGGRPGGSGRPSGPADRTPTPAEPDPPSRLDPPGG